MKCYTVENLKVTPRLFVVERESRKTGGNFYAVEVGEYGRGRELQFVPLHPSLQPQKDEKTIFTKQVFYIEHADLATTKSGGHILVPAKGESNKALVKVYGVEGYRGSLRYTFSDPEPQIVARGHHAQGDAGRMGGGAEFLVIMHPGDRIDIQRLGRLYGDNEKVSIEWDGKELRVYDPDAEPDLELEII